MAVTDEQRKSLVEEWEKAPGAEGAYLGYFVFQKEQSEKPVQKEVKTEQPVPKL